MDQNEVKYDKLLKIKTTGRDDSRADQYCYPYEPTPYGVLERLAYCGYLGKKNHLIDYGCGKGRVETGSGLFPGQKHHLYWRMQPFFRCRSLQTDFIFLIPFLWKY